MNFLCGLQEEDSVLVLDACIEILDTCIFLVSYLTVPCLRETDDDNVHYQGMMPTDGRTNAERHRERILTVSELESLGFWTQPQSNFLLNVSEQFPVFASATLNRVRHLLLKERGTMDYLTVSFIFVYTVFVILIMSNH